MQKTMLLFEFRHHETSVFLKLHAIEQPIRKHMQNLIHPNSDYG